MKIREKCDFFMQNKFYIYKITNLCHYFIKVLWYCHILQHLSMKTQIVHFYILLNPCYTKYSILAPLAQVRQRSKWVLVILWHPLLSEIFSHFYFLQTIGPNGNKLWEYFTLLLFHGEIKHYCYGVFWLAEI